MFCENCRSELNEGDVFCSNCGCSIQQGNSYAQSNGAVYPSSNGMVNPQVQPMMQPMYQQGPGVVVVKKSNKKYVIGGSIAAAVIALVVILIVCLGDHDKKGTESGFVANEEYANTQVLANDPQAVLRSHYENFMGTYELTNEWKDSRDGGHWGTYDFGGHLTSGIEQFGYWMYGGSEWDTDGEFYESIQYDGPVIYLNYDGIDMTAVGDGYYSLDFFEYSTEDGYEYFIDNTHGVAFVYGGGQYYTMYDRGSGWMPDYLYKKVEQPLMTL